MKVNQFTPSEIRCPNCGHLIGQQAYFQTFEYKVAKWLNGQVAPTATKGFDVWKCPDFPSLTIQVKYSNIYKFRSPKARFEQITWNWSSKHQYDDVPDFFVLFGVIDEKENVFTMTRQEFFDYACFYQGRYNLRVSAKTRSDRHFNYIPKIWRYQVKNPTKNLASVILAKM